MAALVCDLVAVPTENPPGRELGRCAGLLAAAMEQLGLAPEVIPVAPSPGLEAPCVVRGTAGTGARTLYFHGHFDVVPAQSHAQFVPVRRDGRITGRGAADMKGGLVAMLYAASAARELGLLGDARIVLHLVCDEETGSVAGSGYLREAGMIDPGAVAMLTPEPTGGVVWHENRGAITLRVAVKGRPAHVGQAHLGVNAFEHMAAISRPLSALARELLERDSMLVVGGACGSGANFNVVPGAAWFSLDRRFNPDEDLDAELERLESTVANAADGIGAEVTVEVLQRQPSAGSDPAGPQAAALASCIASVEGEPPRFERCPGVLETRWYAQLGIPSFAYGPGRLEVSHGPDEDLDERAMRRCAAAYAMYGATVTAHGDRPER
jgi:succinyl-diaminopimelate desuccinylase